MKNSHAALAAILLLLAACREEVESPTPTPTPPPPVEPARPDPLPELPVTEVPGEEAPIWRRDHYRTIPSWQCVYNGKLPAEFAQFVILDLFEFGAAGVQRVKAVGSVPIAYFSAHYEDWRPDAGQFGKKLGKIGGWKGERYIDWKDESNQAIMRDRLRKAKEWGFVGVDIDNVDGPGGSQYFPWLMERAREEGLAVGLKNFVELLPKVGDKVDFFVSEAAQRSELDCYRRYPGLVVRMFYGRGAATPEFIFQIRNGLAGSRF